MAALELVVDVAASGGGGHELQDDATTLGLGLLRGLLGSSDLAQVCGVVVGHEVGWIKRHRGMPS